MPPPSRQPNQTDPTEARRMFLARQSPGPEMNTDEMMEVIIRNPNVLRFEGASRVAQPGEGRVAEQGQITRGQIVSTSASAQSAAGQLRTLASTSDQPSVPTPPPMVITEVKRVLKRKVPTEEIQGRPGIKRLFREAQDIQNIDEKEGCYAAPKADDLYEWAVVIEGPIGSVYQGGTFFCTFKIPNEYPFNPPQVFFHTRIYHCNINSQGEVNMDLLKDNWQSSLGLEHVLKGIVDLLKQCNPDDALVEPIARQYKEDPEQFEKTARLWTERYAKTT